MNRTRLFAAIITGGALLLPACGPGQGNRFAPSTLGTPGQGCQSPDGGAPAADGGVATDGGTDPAADCLDGGWHTTK